MGNVYIPRRYYKKETIYQYIPSKKAGDISKTTADSVQAILDTNYKLWIVGTGDCISPTSLMSSYLSSITSIYFGDGVRPTNLDSWFSGMTALKSINKIPDSVTSMANSFGYNAIYNDFANLNIPDSVIDTKWMFYNNSKMKLDGFTIGKNVKDITNMFYCFRLFDGRVTILGNPTSYDGCFNGTGTGASAYGGNDIYVDYTAACTNIDAIVATNAATDRSYYKTGRVFKGNLVTL